MATAADLTVDNLCEVIRFHLHNLSVLPDEVATIGPGFELKLYGVPADDAMKSVMERLGGTLRITISELPTEMVDGLALVNDVAGESSGINLWQPHEAAIVAEKGVLDDECSITEPTGAGGRS